MSVTREELLAALDRISRAKVSLDEASANYRRVNSLINATRADEVLHRTMMDRDRANDLVEMCKAALSQTLVESSSLMIDAAEQLLAMRPATQDEAEIDTLDGFTRLHNSTPSFTRTEPQLWVDILIAYRAAERRLLPFADEVKR